MSAVSPLDAAKFYHACGYSIVPIVPDGTKKPAVAWEWMKSERVSLQNMERWFQSGRNGIALIQGQVSGLKPGWVAELLEFETLDVYERWAKLMEQSGHGEILDKAFPCVMSPGGGVHLYYRHLDEPQGNQKLARGRALVAGHNGDTLIETRGEGGYVLAPGSPAACHKSGKEYRLMSGTFKRIPVLTIAERQTIFSTCRALDEKPAKPAPAPRPSFIPTQGAAGTRPGDDFNERGATEALDCLLRHGWDIEKEYGDHVTLRRPGKSDGQSATYGFIGYGALYVFSSNCSPFEMEGIYGPFEIVTRLDFGGDFKACARYLSGRGYGAPLPEREPRRVPTPKVALPDDERRAMVREAKEMNARLDAVLNLCTIGHLTAWPEVLPEPCEGKPVYVEDVSAELLSMTKTMGLTECIESLRSELGTETKGKAWDLLMQVDALMDFAGVYVEHMDCVMHHLEYLAAQEATA